EQRRRRDAEAGIFHVLAKSRTFAAQGAQEREDALVDDREHLAWFERLEPRPSQIVVGPPALVLSFRENTAFHRYLQGIGFPLLDGVKLIESLDEKQICNLLDY